MDLRRRDLLKSAAYLGLAGMAVPGAAAWAQGGAKIRLGEARGAGQSAQFVLAIHDNLLSSRGLDIELSPFSSGAAMGPALIAGNLDIIANGDIPAIPIFASGEPIKALCPLSDFSADQAIVVRKSITEPAQLDGARLALFKGSVATLFIERYAAHHGLDINKIDLIHMDPAQQPPALASGDIDGYINWEPHIWSATARFPDSHVLARANDGDSYMKVFNILLVREEFLNANREAVVNFVAGLVEAYDALNSDPDVAVRTATYIRDLLGVDIPADVLAGMMQRRRYTMTIDQEFIDIETQNTEFLFNLERIRHKPEVLSWLDPSVLREVRPELVKI